MKVNRLRSTFEQIFAIVVQLAQIGFFNIIEQKTSYLRSKPMFLVKSLSSLVMVSMLLLNLPAGPHQIFLSITSCTSLTSCFMQPRFFSIYSKSIFCRERDSILNCWKRLKAL